MSEQTLQLNETTGYYEATLVVRVEKEILRRALFRYLEEENLDPFDINHYQQAITTITRVSKWLDHPRAEVKPHVLPPVIEKVLEPPSPMPAQTTPLPRKGGHGSLSDTAKATLRARAIKTPRNQWESLRTPIPQEGNHRSKEKQAIYDKRYVEKKYLEELERELAPLDGMRLETIADAVNGSRLR